MTTTRYCYHCGMSHPEDEMRLMVTKTGKRWRCIKSVAAIKKTAAERDAFGKKVTKINFENASAKLRSRLSKDE